MSKSKSLWVTKAAKDRWRTVMIWLARTERTQHSCQRCGTHRCGTVFGSVGQRALAHSVHPLERSSEVLAAWRALFLPSEEGAGGGFQRRLVQPFSVPVETPKACALIGVHLLAAEGEAGPVAVNLLISGAAAALNWQEARMLLFFGALRAQRWKSRY